ncbi:AprI/Inh family metalloprotease inhibitor [Pseudomonas fontis]|uniref:Protease inhibitor Inh/omp19 family protein n=1 Tax=Pseudomonas fontis TaxID=2942633 RepID=A0ABT5NLW3_9PSED|nr:AprI/Inh family metalloprotease inhibitor [Pseudomonas fontis]MDD0975385.1 protease inhibitor Inh/omp19 family protein [Pseudomonas fontis]MDD0989253.1 protease inhibitor Inh/omp19 family protein [Pseudomonas fontis]
MTLKKLFALSAFSLMLSTEVSMASSLLLPNPGQLAGSWQLYPEDDQGAGCQVQLKAPETLLGGDLDCVARLIGERATGWQVTPDTVAFMGGDGTAVVHFNRYKPNIYKWTNSAGQHLLLERITNAQ